MLAQVMGVSVKRAGLVVFCALAGTFVFFWLVFLGCSGTLAGCTWYAEGRFLAITAGYVAFWMCTVVWAWYFLTQWAKPSLPRLPWYPKKVRPSFVDAMAALRTRLWREKLSAKSEENRKLMEMGTPKTWFDCPITVYLVDLSQDSFRDQS